MDIYIYSVLFSIGSPVLDFINNGNARHHWFSMMTGMLIACALYHSQRNRPPFLKSFFNRKSWCSPSARLDYWVLIINPVIVFVAFTTVFNTVYAVATTIGLHAMQSMGISWAGGNEWFLGACLALILFLANDFMRWWLHYLLHKIPVLWELHKVHHSAAVLNFATAERFHPLETYMFSIGTLVVAGMINGIFWGLFGDQLSPWTLFGANGFFVLFNAAGGILRHSPAWVSFGPKWERWVISPALHQIHHSDNPEHFDKNLGGSLAIWDRWFGTLYIPNGRLELTYGIGGEEDKHFQSVSALYLYPLKAIWHRLRSS